MKLIFLFTTIGFLGCSAFPWVKEDSHKPSYTNQIDIKSKFSEEWLKSESPVDLSVSIRKIYASNKFCDSHEFGFFGHKFLWFFGREPELDFRVWLRQKNSNIAHVSSSDGYELIKIMCDSEVESKFNLFFNNQIISRDDELDISIKIYENDQAFADNKLEKLNKILNDIGTGINATVDKGLIQKNKGDNLLIYFSFVKIPFDLVNSLNDLFFGEESLVTTFNINMYRKDNFVPRSSSVKERNIAYVVTKDREKISDFSHEINLKDIIAICYEITVSSNNLDITFEILVNKRP